MADTQKTIDAIGKLAASINPLLGGVIAAIGFIRAVRDAAKAANPELPEGAFPSDAELIQKLITDSGLLKSEAATLKAWLQTQLPPSP